MKALSEKYGAENFVSYGTFTFDVLGGDDIANRAIFSGLQSLGFIDPENESLSKSLKFLQKVIKNKMYIIFCRWMLMGLRCTTYTGF